MTLDPSVFVHPRALVETEEIGAGTVVFRVVPAHALVVGSGERR